MGPDRTETFSYVRIAKILQHDPVARPVWELSIGLSGAGEVSIDFDAIADVRHQQERRPAMVDGKRLGIAFGLALGLDHGFGPRSEEHTSELQSLMRISYAVFCLKK